MEAKFEPLIESIKNSDGFPLCVLMESLMKYFKYEIHSDLYYAIGAGSILTMPFTEDTDELLYSGFSYVKSVCYYSGAWAIDYITADAAAFVKKLKESWHEWADMQQPMPIVVGITENGSVDFYILTGLENGDRHFCLIDSKGNLTVKSDEEMCACRERLGYCTIDVPFNFMAKSNYYRTPERAFSYIVADTSVNLANNGYLEKLASESAPIKEDCLQKLIARVDKNKYDTGLYRGRVAKALEILGREEEAVAYYAAEKLWKRFFLETDNGSVKDFLWPELLKAERELQGYIEDNYAGSFRLGTFS